MRFALLSHLVASESVAAASLGVVRLSEPESLPMSSFVCRITEMCNMRRTILFFSFLGFSVFAAILTTSFFSPLTIERAAREIVRIEVERRVANKIDALSNSRVVILAQKALGKTDAELQEAKRLLADDVPRKVAAAVANMLNADCECRKRLAQLAVNAKKAGLRI